MSFRYSERVLLYVYVHLLPRDDDLEADGAGDRLLLLLEQPVLLHHPLLQTLGWRITKENLAI